MPGIEVRPRRGSGQSRGLDGHGAGSVAGDVEVSRKDRGVGLNRSDIFFGGDHVRLPGTEFRRRIDIGLHVGIGHGWLVGNGLLDDGFAGSIHFERRCRADGGRKHAEACCDDECDCGFHGLCSGCSFFLVCVL